MTDLLLSLAWRRLERARELLTKIGALDVERTAHLDKADRILAEHRESAALNQQVFEQIAQHIAESKRLGQEIDQLQSEANAELTKLNVDIGSRGERT